MIRISELKRYTMLNYLSVCSGIEAATVAWDTLGWKPFAYSEFDKFPSAVLNHHYQDVPNLGDLTKYKEWENDGTVGVIVGGTPCVSFSVAGLRKGLSDSRNLTESFVGLCDKYDPEWVLWENVPGVLSSKDNAFGEFLAGLSGASEALIPDKRWANSGLVSGEKRCVAWRILDAQYFGVAQRRRRVFVLATRGAGNFKCAAALFPIGEGMYWNTPKGREKREEVTGDARKGIESSNQIRNYPEIDPVGTISDGAHMGGGLNGQDAHTGRVIAATVYENHPNDSRVKEMGDVSTTVNSRYGTGGGNIPLVAFKSNMGSHVGGVNSDGMSEPVMSNAPPAVAFAQNSRDEVRLQGGDGQISGALAAEPGMKQTTYVAENLKVRRLTPEECELLQGFPKGYTKIPYRNKSRENCPDGPRYKALGNSMAVPVMRWLGERIQFIENYK